MKHSNFSKTRMNDKEEKKMKMSEFFVIWYDDCGVPHDSWVYFVDPSRGRFLVAHEDKNFRWISTSDCELADF